METEKKLDQLAEFVFQRDALEMQKKEMIATVYTPEIAKAVADIEAEFAGKVEAVDTNIAALKAEIEADVLAGGNTVKGSSMMAVWNKGRVSWDGKKLDGMIALIPQLAQARKEGEPTVSFRAVK